MSRWNEIRPPQQKETLWRLVECDNDDASCGESRTNSSTIAKMSRAAAISMLSENKELRDASYEAKRHFQSNDPDIATILWPPPKPAPVGKPKLKSFEFYDYNEMVDFIAKKYNINERDYAGKFDGRQGVDVKPYQDFWHFLLHEFMPDHFHNGAFVTINWEDVQKHAEGLIASPIDQLNLGFNDYYWAADIAKLYVKEFGDKDVTMKVEW